MIGGILGGALRVLPFLARYALPTAVIGGTAYSIGKGKREERPTLPVIPLAPQTSTVTGDAQQYPLLTMEQMLDYARPKKVGIPKVNWAGFAKWVKEKNPTPEEAFMAMNFLSNIAKQRAEAEATFTRGAVPLISTYQTIAGQMPSRESTAYAQQIAALGRAIASTFDPKLKEQLTNLLLVKLGVFPNPRDIEEAIAAGRK